MKKKKEEEQKSIRKEEEIWNDFIYEREEKGKRREEN